jgi:hypothetical protein
MKNTCIFFFKTLLKKFDPIICQVNSMYVCGWVGGWVGVMTKCLREYASKFKFKIVCEK